ncbi:Hypothetical predicted protein, partial [Pelobates cultripes]
PLIKISEEEGAYVLTAPDFGIERLYYVGKTSQIHTAMWMRGKTCGMCGLHDGETEREYQRPDGSLATDVHSFSDSWTLLDDTCTGACKMERATVTLEKEAWESTCYSVHPVLRCAKGCAPRSVTPVAIGFSCVAA